jgi:uncharacterized protein (DUF2384 family)
MLVREAPAAAQRVAAKTFFKIAEAWRMSIAEQRAAMGGVSKQTLYNWRAEPNRARFTNDQLDRISYLLGIYKALRIVFTRPEQADSWVRRPNAAPPFGGKPAADLLFSGRIEDIIRVRRYLDGVRGAW